MGSPSTQQATGSLAMLLALLSNLAGANSCPCLTCQILWLWRTLSEGVSTACLDAKRATAWT